MKYLKYAGFCAAGFLLEAATGSALAFLVFYMFIFCLLITVPTCILLGKSHMFFTRKIRSELGACPVAYYVIGMGLPVLLWVGAAVIGITFPELLTDGKVNSLSDGFAGLIKLFLFLGASLNAMITTASGAYFVYKEHKNEQQG